MHVAFTPPEVLRNSPEQNDAQIDVYALGVMLYQLCAGRLPYADPDGKLPERKEELLRRMTETEPPVLRSINPAISPELEAIVQTALARDPARRYRDMASLTRDLRAYLTDHVVEAYAARSPWPWLLELKKWTIRHKAAATVLAVILVAGVTVALALMAKARSDRSAALARADAAEAQAREGQAQAAARLADQMSALRQAELYRRSGQWSRSLAELDRAEAAGYADAVDLALRRLEAAYATGDAALRAAQVEQLYGFADYGSHRDQALLRLGEFELFDEKTFEAGVAKVKEALAGDLAPAEREFAQGLVAESTPAALEHFHNAIRLDPILGNAHRQAFGLELLLGRHEEAAAHLTLFKAFFPGDPSIEVVEAAILFAQGRHEDAQQRLQGLKGRYDPGMLDLLRAGFSLLSALTRFDDLDALIRNDPPDGAAFSAALFRLLSTVRPPRLGKVGPRLPNLPCTRNATRPFRLLLFTDQGALRPLPEIIPLITDPKQIGRIHRAMLEASRYHPESSVFLGAAMLLEILPLRDGEDRLQRLRAIADLLEQAAQASTIYPPASRSLRYRAAAAQFELFQSVGDTEARERGVAHIRWLLSHTNPVSSKMPQPSALECRKYWEWAYAAGDYALARQLVDRLENAFGKDRPTARARALVEEAEGSYARALATLNQLLKDEPNDPWAQAKRTEILNRLHDTLDEASNSRAAP